MASSADFFYSDTEKRGFPVIINSQKGKGFDPIWFLNFFVALSKIIQKIKFIFYAEFRQKAVQIRKGTFKASFEYY